MLGFLSFLAFAFSIAFAVSLVLLVVRSVKKQPRKPIVILAVVSVLAVIGLSVPISRMYVPAEKPDGVAEIAEEEQPDAVPDTASAVEKTANVENVDKSVDKKVASQETETADMEQAADPAPAETEEPAAPADAEPDFIEAHRSDIVVSADMVLERFIPGYKIPLAPQLWTVVRFDDSGKVAAGVDVTDKKSKNTEFAFVVLSPIMEGEKMTGGTPHFVSVGDVVYGDDGSCDDVLSSVSELFGGSE